jgi:hypothetical protein
MSSFYCALCCTSFAVNNREEFRADPEVQKMQSLIVEGTHDCLHLSGGDSGPGL